MSTALAVLTVMQVAAAVLSPLVWWRHRFGSDSLLESVVAPVIMLSLFWVALVVGLVLTGY